jgi:transposase
MATLITTPEELATVVGEAVRKVLAEHLRKRDEQEGYSLSEAARKLGISVRTLQRRIKAGDVEVFRPQHGGSPRVRLPDARNEAAETLRAVRKSRLG